MRLPWRRRKDAQVAEPAPAAPTEEDLDARAAHLDEREQELARREAQLAERYASERRRIAELVRREQAVAEREAELGLFAPPAPAPGAGGLDASTATTLDELERLIDAVEDHDTAERWWAYVLSLRELADEEGRLPADLAGLIDDVFGDPDARAALLAGEN